MPCRWASLSIGALFGEHGGGSFAGTFERSVYYIWVPFLDSEVIKIFSLSEALASPRHIQSYS